MVWDAKTGKLLWKFEKEKGVYSPYHSIAFSPDGELVAVPIRRGLFLLDAETGQIIRMESTQGNYLAAFSPDGRYLISGSSGGEVRIWDWRRSSEVSILGKHHSWLTSVAFSPKGLLAASASDDNSVKLWDIKNKKEIKTLEGHTVSFSPDGAMVATASKDNRVIIWDIKTGNELQAYKGHRKKIISAEFSPNGSKIVSVSNDSIIKIWDVKTGHEMLSFSNTVAMHCAAYSPDGQHIVSASADKSVRIWDIGTTRSHQLFGKDFSYSFSSIHFTSDGKSIVIDDKEVIDIDTGQKRLISENKDTRQATSQQFTFPIDSSEIENSSIYAFSKDLNLFANFDDWEKINLWHKNQKRWSAPIKTKQGYVFSMVFSPDNRYLLASPDDETIRIWSVETGKEITHFDFPDIVNNLTYSPDNSMLAFTEGKYLRIWDSKSFRELYVFEEQDDDGIYSIAYSPDSKRIVSVSSSGSIRVWSIRHLQDIIDETHERFKNRPLTLEERRKYYLE